MNKNINIGLQDWIGKYINHLNLLNKSNSTIDSYVKTLRKFIRDEEVEDINEFIDMDRAWWLNDWVARQKEEDKISIATINKKIKQMSSWYHFLVYEGIVKENPLYKFPKVNQTNGLRYKEKCMTDEQAKSILKAIDSDEFKTYNNYMNKRNSVIIYMFMTLAPRIEELSRIRLEDLDLKDGNKIYIRGKGHGGEISRFTNCNDKVKNMIIELINYRPNRIYLFEDEHGRQLGTQGIRKIFYLACNIAGVENITPHMCRHYLRLFIS